MSEVYHLLRDITYFLKKGNVAGLCMCLCLHVKLVLRCCKSQCQGRTRGNGIIAARGRCHTVWINDLNVCRLFSPAASNTEGFQPLSMCNAARLNCGKWGRRPVNNSCHDAPQLPPHCHPNACLRKQWPASTISALNTWLGTWQVLIFSHRGLVHLNRAAALAIIIILTVTPSSSETDHVARQP